MFKGLNKKYYFLLLTISLIMYNQAFSVNLSNRILILKESDNLSNQQTNDVISKVQNELTNNANVRFYNDSDAFRVMHEKNINCNLFRNRERAAEIGRFLGTKHILFCLVSKANEHYIVSLTLMDLGNNRIFQSSHNYKGSFDLFLSNSIKDAIKELLAKN